MSKIETEVTTIRFPKDLMTRIKEKAKKESRSFTGMLRYMALFYLEVTNDKSNKKI